MKGVFPGLIHHLLTSVIVAFVVGVAYILQNKIEDLETELAVVNEKDRARDTKCENLQTKVEFMEISFKDSLDKILYVVDTKQKAKQENHPKIAFYANRVTDHINLGVHRTLIFGNVVTNDGNCYQFSTGLFIPSVSGVYVFDVRILLCSPGHELRTHLVVEGEEMAAYYTGGSSHCSNGGGMTVLHVGAGESVWVRVATSDGENNIAWESSFSGFLLYT